MKSKNGAKTKTEIAVFAAGCFWGVQYVFDRMPGIVKTEVGYAGGKMEDPSYEDVSTSRTGHAEAVRVEFDPKKISYEKLLEIFFKCHDPTTMNRQGPDIGPQYRSVIFYFNEEQRKIAEKAKKDYEKVLGLKIVTEIVKAGKFYTAEDYHQKYYDKKGSKPYCHIVPRVDL